MSSFHQELVLNQWMMGFFQDNTLPLLKERLAEDRYRGIGEDGQTKFFDQLRGKVNRIDQDLSRYDKNIVEHWTAITERRNKVENTVFQMKYFQYLSLLFTEIYLDYYFNHRQQLLDGLNGAMQTYQATSGVKDYFQPFNVDELNKLAFWNATGSGKTLLLHVNIRQYLHYFQNGNKNSYPNKIILLTPNEGLSNQHLAELQLSGFGSCRLFNKASSDDTCKGMIEIIDINKLGDEMGDKTVAVESFEGGNLVLVDEGHRGTSSADGAWMNRREALVRGGFTFEYSATFGQAVAKSLTVVKAREEIKKKQFPLLLSKLFEKSKVKDLTAEEKIAFEAAKKTLTLTNDDERKACTMAMREIYAKSILFDYSYKFFYEDGYGKEFVILNLKDQNYKQDETARLYLTACLLSFYQQQYLWDINHEKLTKFNIEKPLWVFVGNTVSSEDADVLKVLKFLAGFLKDDIKTCQWIKGLLDNTALLLDANGHNIFHDRFIPLMGKFNSADEVYADILKRLFNTGSRQRLKVVNLRGSKGELALRVGEAEPFGLINIGDDAKFFKEAATDNNAKLFDTETDDFSGSMFDTLNSKDSTLHVLIGSRKFTEGWSSWRVSTMGLLNMGKGEGSQIIQLFGRGVRLKGEGYSLKRSTPGERPKGVHLERLETLNVFGVNAGYMGTFKDYLRGEGVTPSDEILELDFKTRCNVPKGKLKTLTLKDGYKDNQAKGFNRTHFPWLYEVPGEFAGKINDVHIDLDLYPKLGVLATGNQDGAAVPAINVRQEGKIAFKTMALFDFDRIYLAVQEFKQREGWNNLRLERSRLIDFCLQGNDWYTLSIPQADMLIGSIADISRQEDILIRLLQDYTDRFYKALKMAYEGQFYDVVIVKEDDNALLKEYHFAIDDTATGVSYKEKIEKLQALVTAGKLGEANEWNAGQMVAICFDHHLYHPLFSTKDGTPLNNGLVPLKMRPLAFDAPSEVRFVRDLEKFYLSAPGKEIIGNRSLYLLRNAASRSKGLGFALAGNFYPDFLLWLVDDITGKQWLNFIDPKGLRQMDLTGPKLRLYKEVKVLQKKLGDPQLTLNAFIVSATRFDDLINVSGKQADLENRHVLFMSDGVDGRGSYLKKMFEWILDDSQGVQ